MHQEQGADGNAKVYPRPPTYWQRKAAEIFNSAFEKDSDAMKDVAKWEKVYAYDCDLGATSLTMAWAKLTNLGVGPEVKPDLEFLRDGETNGMLFVMSEAHGGVMRFVLNGHALRIHFQGARSVTEQDLLNIGQRIAAGLNAGAEIIYDPDKLFPVSHCPEDS